MTEFIRGRLRTVVRPDATAMGEAAADHVAGRLKALLADPSSRARVVFAAAASQLEFLAALASTEGIDWSRVHAFHLDEYVGLPAGSEQAFGNWLDRHIFGRVRPGRVEKLDPTTTDAATECARYGALLADGGLDLALIGIGENGHLAFNDPHVADFDDPLIVKPVDLDEVSRAQQVHDGAFAAIELVPRSAMTVTMSTILASRAISVVVPGANKARAVARTLTGPIETACPASALRRHPDAVLFVDEAAMSAGDR